jgi:cyclic pyranopterin phosphate synthase
MVEPTPDRGPLVDRFGRVHTNLRISVTDRCNIRCFYCMPAEDIRFKPRNELLTFEEIERFARVAASLGVNKLRLTGGEPLVRHGVPELVRQLRKIPGIRDIALTTNAMLLTDQAAALREAGLDRLNISLDTLDAEKFAEITRRDALQQVLDGIFAAQDAGFTNIKLNAVAIRDLTETDIVPLAEFARQHAMKVRFLEYMPLDGDQAWNNDHVLSGEEILRILSERFGPLEPIDLEDPSQPAVDFRYEDSANLAEGSVNPDEGGVNPAGGGSADIGLIQPVSEPFCHRCNRLRITAEGQIRNCLFSVEEWDARALLRGEGSDDDIAELIRASIGAKHRAHGINTPEFVRPQRAMYQIGG